MEQQNNNFALIGLILGIVGIVLAFVLGFIAPYVGLIVSIIGLVLSVKANKIEKTGMGTAGLVLSIIGIVLNAIYLIIFIACVGLIATAAGAAASGLLY